MNADDKLKRSIDTLQRLYAVIAGLAIGEALRGIVKGTGAALEVRLSGVELPLCIATLVTVIPFVHGMNRHLDDHIGELATRENPNRMVRTLLVDFLVFVFESGLLFVLGASVNAPGPWFSNILLTLLIVDIVWTVPRTFLELEQTDWTRPDDAAKEHRRQQLVWAVINLTACALVGLLRWRITKGELEAWLILAVAMGRSAADYWTGKKFYFPLVSGN
ncbi:MAG TPA: hypothetical protein VFQ43_19185 [Nitrososphaera sp.]|nr:hypothetical protein [Nitrososphaera sp.]